MKKIYCHFLFKAVLAIALVAMCGLQRVQAQTRSTSPKRQMEALGRGLIAANTGAGMLVSWRLLGTEAPTTQFNLYKDGALLTAISGDSPTSYLDATGDANSVYAVAPVSGEVEGNKSSAVMVFSDTSKDGTSKVTFPYKTLTLDVPPGVKTPDGVTCSYTPNDMSVGDLDGDGEYELIVKWDPSNSQDNANSGYTGNVYIDAYKLDGTKLWRIDLGRNIRAGAHYTQFMVYDLDGDGYAEIAMKTSDGTVDGLGNVIGDGSADYRTSSGMIMSGNEYLTIFQGSTGKAITTIDYVPGRNVTSSWGDTYGNRSERMLAAIAYLDGVKPSLIMCRGYYTNAYVVAYDFDGANLTQRWYHKSETKGEGLYGEGNYQLSIADLNGDGFDEIIYGAAVLKNDGTLLYRTGFGRGGALHVSDLDPDCAGLEVFGVHEEASSDYGYEMRDQSGNVVFGEKTGIDVTRGMAADIDPNHRGFEMWSTGSNDVFNARGEVISSTNKPSINFRIYWTGDVCDELLDATGAGGAGGKIEKWNASSKGVDRLFSFYNVNNSTLNNSTKANPCISADLFGDWREEFIVRSSTDPSKITIFTTSYTTTHRVYTLMHDPHYRLSVAWQNVGYNQPPHLGYYLPDAVENLTQPNIYVYSYTMTATPNNATYGSVTVNDGTSPQTVNEGDAVTFAAAANAGYQFVRWTKADGTEVSTDNPYIIASANADVDLMAVFAPYQGGNGTKGDPYQINSVAGLEYFATETTGMYGKLTANVTLTTGVSFNTNTTLIVDAGKILTLATATFTLPNMIMQEGTEIDGANATVTSIASLTVCKDVDNTKWNAIALPFVPTSVTLINGSGEVDGTFVSDKLPQTASEYTSMSYDGEARYTNGTADPSGTNNWRHKNPANGTGEIGEMFAFGDGVSSVMFTTTSPATTIITEKGSQAALTYHSEVSGKDNSHRGWNTQNGMTTRSMLVKQATVNDPAIVQMYNGSNYTPQTLGDAGYTAKPFTPFFVQATAAAQNIQFGDGSTSRSSSMGESLYCLELHGEAGELLDRLYVGVDLDTRLYNVGKMGAMGKAVVLAAKVNGETLCSAVAERNDGVAKVQATIHTAGRSDVRLVWTNGGHDRLWLNGTELYQGEAIAAVNGDYTLTIGAAPTGYEDMSASVQVYGTRGTVVMEGVKVGSHYVVYDTAGNVMADAVATSHRVELPLPTGIYVVSIDKQMYKVAVK